MKLLIGTNNEGKVREYQSILQALRPDLAVLTLQDVGIVLDVEETGETFEENARLKAVAYSAISGLPTIADDSGLEVEALGGFPGVRSARWSGPTAADRNRHLLERLSEIAPGARAARFVCVSCLRLPDGGEAVGRGTLEGQIALEPCGEGGFGYDPLFRLADGRHLAELSRDEKNAISHRGRAVRDLAPKLLALLG